MRALCCFVVSLPLFCASVSHAETIESVHPNLNTRHMIGIGGSYQKSDAELRASVKDLAEIKLDLENLGVDDTDTSWLLDYRWRFAEKWMLVGVAYTFEQSGDRTAQRDFNFDGKEFKAGVSVDTSMEIDTYILDLLYQVYRNEKLELMLGGGIHAIDVDAAISGEAFVNEERRQRASANSEILAPLPNLRAQAFYAINDRWGVGVVAGWLSANYDDYDGSFLYLNTRLAYAFDSGFTASVGYQLSEIDLTYTESRKETELNVDFHGPTFLLSYRF